MITPRGEDVAGALRDWIKDSIKSGPASRADLGKFFFGLTTASAGGYVAIRKLDETLTPDMLAVIVLVGYGVTALLALFMAFPQELELRGDTDLLQRHTAAATAVRDRSTLWFVLWMMCSVLAMISLFATRGSSASTAATYQGRRLDEWVQLSGDLDDSTRRAAVTALRASGDAGIMALVSALSVDDTTARTRAANAIRQLCATSIPALERQLSAASEPARSRLVAVVESLRRDVAAGTAPGAGC
jgi:hypothetical protein